MSSEFQIENEFATASHSSTITWKFFWTSVTASCISNLAGTTVGHPIDTIRVSSFLVLRMQNAFLGWSESPAAPIEGGVLLYNIFDKNVSSLTDFFR